MTNRIAFIFSGQGAQYCGMGKDFYEQIETGRKALDRALELLGFSVPELRFTENDRLDIMEYIQMAMVTTSITMIDVLKERGVKPDVTTGLSLREYYMLAAASAMSEDNVITTVRQRGTLMQEAVPAGIGAIAVVLALDAIKIEEVLGGTGDVQIANYSCPGQIVISGKIEAVEKTNETLLAEGAKRVVMLNVGGPFRSGVLQGAGKKLGTMLGDVEIHQPAIPCAANVTVSYVTSTDEVKLLLEKQVSSPVRWQQSVETTIAGGIDTFIEIGPDRILVGFMRKTSRNVRAFNIEKLEDVKKVVEQLK